MPNMAQGQFKDAGPAYDQHQAADVVQLIDTQFEGLVCVPEGALD